VSLSQNVEIVCEGSSQKVSGHITETGQQFDKITQEVNAKTKILATYLAQHIKRIASFKL
jgi:hypothetical protein